MLLLPSNVGQGSRMPQVRKARNTTTERNPDGSPSDTGAIARGPRLRYRHESPPGSLIHWIRNRLGEKVGRKKSSLVPSRRLLTAGSCGKSRYQGRCTLVCRVIGRSASREPQIYWRLVGVFVPSVWYVITRCGGPTAARFQACQVRTANLSRRIQFSIPGAVKRLPVRNSSKRFRNRTQYRVQAGQGDGQSGERCRDSTFVGD